MQGGWGLGACLVEGHRWGAVRVGDRREKIIRRWRASMSDNRDCLESRTAPAWLEGVYDPMEQDQNRPPKGGSWTLIFNLERKKRRNHGCCCPEGLCWHKGLKGD